MIDWSDLLELHIEEYTQICCLREIDYSIAARALLILLIHSYNASQGGVFRIIRQYGNFACLISRGWLIAYGLFSTNIGGNC